jgi:hypothetical protein
VDHESPQSRAEHFHHVADRLRRLAAELRYDIRRGDQLRALADGIERFADRLELEAAHE